MTAGKKHPKLTQILWTIACWATGIVILMMFVLGLMLVWSPKTGTDPGSFANRNPVGTIAIGLLLLAVATATLVVTMNRWARALPGLLAAATLNGLISLVQGHVINLPSKPISRVDALVATLLFLGSTVLSALAFKGRSLSFIDRLALLGVVSSLAWGVLRDSITFAAVSTFLCLLFAWVYSRVRNPPSHDPRSESETRVARLS